MKFRHYFLFIVSFVSIISNVNGQWPLRDTVELQSRDGLPNYFQKIKNGAITKVGFIGGSITSTDGWRPIAVEWMKERYSNDNVVDVNAAIGGTNSKYGVFRMERHLLEKDDYDLVFIEFGLNDNPGTSSDVEKSIEGMIRKIWLKNPYTDICFVYTIRNTSMPDIDAGKMTLTLSKHDSIASYYNIPSILWGVEWSKLLASGTVVILDDIVNEQTSQNAAGQYVLTVDNVHPTDYGHQLYADVLARCFKSMEDVTGVYSHEIKSPLIADNFVNAKMLPLSPHNNHGMNLIDTEGQKDYLDRYLDEDTEFLVSENSNEYYSLTFNGTILGLNLVIGPSSGRYYIEIDGDIQEYNAFDGYCTRWRKHFKFVNVPDGEHKVKIYPSPNTLSLSEKENILIDETRKQDLRDNPEKYQTNEFIFSDVFISGEIANFITEKKNICAGDSLLWQGSFYNSTGQYLVTYQDSDGYDSIHELDLVVYPLPDFTLGNNTTMVLGDTLTVAIDNSFESYLWSDSDTLPEKEFIAAEMDSGVHLIWLLVTDANQCQNSDTIEITIDKDTSVSGENRDHQFLVYPNPATNILQIASVNILKETTVISLINSDGATVYNQSFQDSRIYLTLDISTHPPGIYFLQIQTGNQETVCKIIKV